MREWNHVLRAAVVTNLPAPANDAREGVEREELGNCKFADGKNEARLKEFELAFQPAGARRDFLFVWHPIASAGVLAGKAAADRREVDPTTRGLFVPSQRGFDPAEKCLACRPCEGASEQRFPGARSLSHQKDAAADRSTGDRRLMHGGAYFAVGKGAQMGAQGVHDQPKRIDAIR